MAFKKKKNYPGRNQSGGALSRVMVEPVVTTGAFSVFTSTPRFRQRHQTLARGSNVASSVIIVGPQGITDHYYYNWPVIIMEHMYS